MKNSLTRLSRRAVLSVLAALPVALCVLGPGAAPAFADADAKKVLQLPMRTDGPKSLDPAQGSTQYDNIACAQMYETLLTFSYAKPSQAEPLLLAEMPVFEADGVTLKCKLKPGVVFHDNACFPGGKGRVLKTDDVFYSIKRLADKANGLKNWWLLEGAIKGFDEYKAAQNAAVDKGGKFDYDAPVEGFVKVSDTEFKIVLTKPVYRFLYTLCQFQTSMVPREAVEKYGKDFSFNPVGTGPFMLDRWEPKQYLYINRNPAYHEVKYPGKDQWDRNDRRKRMDKAAGQKVPFVDRMEFTMFVQDQPMWLQFNSNNLGFIEVPAEYFEKAFDKRTKELIPAMTDKGVTSHNDALLDFIFDGFNMVDPILGGFEPEKKALRQAICLGIDRNEINEAFYNGINIIYDGPIPPALDGYPEGGKAPKSYRGPDLDRAKAKLKEAGWPDGKNAKTGEQLVVHYYTSNSTTNQQQAEMIKRQLARIGIQLDVAPVDFSTLIEYTNNKKAQMFGFAWGSDYPDAENNLAMFYSPNESPGSNHYNYKNPEYDKLYEQILVMKPSTERTKIYEQMHDMLIEDAPFHGGMARTRFYLMAPWIVNCRPTERTFSWFKYLDVDDSKRK